MDDDRLLLPRIAEGKYPKHRPSVIWVVEGDTVYDPSDRFADGSALEVCLEIHNQRGSENFPQQSREKFIRIFTPCVLVSSGLMQSIGKRKFITIMDSWLC